MHSPPPPLNANGMPKTPHMEGFLDLKETYQILSNDELRDAYDKHKICFQEETLLPEKEGRVYEDYINLIDELFGANAVRNYIRDVQITPVVNEMFGFASENCNNINQESVEVRSLQQ